MRRDFDRIYAEEADPWAIGSASAPRYDQYRDLVLAHVRGGALLDIGSGLGAFLARFRHDFAELTGVETAAEAVRRGREAHPDIEFVHRPAEGLGESPLHDRKFDAILASDVIYYLRPADRARLVDWIAQHLAPGGWALVAAWCPGKRYLEPDELRALVRSSLRIGDDLSLPSGHVALMCEPKRRVLALTFDYGSHRSMETVTDWERDTFVPTEALLAAAEETAFPVSFVVDVDDYVRLNETDPSAVRRMEDQLRQAVERGHDVQLCPVHAGSPSAGWVEGAQRLAHRIQHPQLHGAARIPRHHLRIDGREAERLPQRAVAAAREMTERPPEALRRRRRVADALTRIGLGRLAPAAVVPPEVGHTYLVVAGRVSRELGVDAIAAAAMELRRLGFDLVGLNELAELVRRDHEETAALHEAASGRVPL